MTRDEMLRIATKGDVHATAFLTDTISAFHTWDDLIDQDHDVPPEEVTKAFFHAFVGMATNPFYASNYAHLFPVVCNAITNWLAANDMERTGAVARGP